MIDYKKYEEMSLTGKSLEEIAYTAQQDYYVKYSDEGSPPKHECEWDKCPTKLTKESYKFMVDIILMVDKLVMRLEK
jgi:hypothetical protein